MKYDVGKIDLSSNNSMTIVLQNIKPNTKVLEFGPATGYMTRYMTEDLQCSVSCVELDAEAADVAKQYCDNMLVADIESMAWMNYYEGETFDHIIFADVLEHLRDPLQTLKNVREFLKEEGTIIASVPNIGHNAILMELLQGRFDYNSLGLLDDTHIHFFTRKSMLELYQAAGVRPIKIFTTVAHPAHTEFKQDYSHLPWDIQSYLRARPDCHVYQFIGVCKRNEDILAGEQCQEVPAIDDEQLYLQMYWDSGNGYNAKDSVTLPILHDGGYHTYQLHIPRQGLLGIRFDAVNIPACVTIKSITMSSTTSTDPYVIFPQQADCAKMVVNAGTFVIEEKPIYQLISTTNDPQIFINELTLPKDDEGQLVEVQVNMAIEIGNNDVQLLENRLTTVEKENIERDQIIAQMVGSLSWRCTSPLRNFKGQLVIIQKQVKNKMKKLLHHSFNPPLVPIHDLVTLASGHYNWQSTGDRPYFVLEFGHYVGWIKISWSAVSEDFREVKLSFVDEKGNNQSQVIHLGVMENEDIPVQRDIFVHLPEELKQLRLYVGDFAGPFYLKDISMQCVTKYDVAVHNFKTYMQSNQTNLFILSKKGIQAMAAGDVTLLWSKFKQFRQLGINQQLATGENYQTWALRHGLTVKIQQDIKMNIERLAYKPLISIIMPVYNVDEKWLRMCIDSVVNQLYPYWELCIADDASPKPHIKAVLQEYLEKDERIKVVFREKNGHISLASNSALELATGEYIGLLDHDDELALDALYENVLLLNEHSDADMIYSDEDKISEEGIRHSPFFKPDWSPDTILGQMYTCHFGVYRSSLIRSIGGFRAGYEGSQDYDLVLRATEKTKHIYHIPKILYHWRTIAESTASGADAKGYAYVAGLKALQDALDRRGEGGWVEHVSNYPGQYRVHYPVINSPRISIIIPTRDMSAMLETCLKSIFDKTTYDNYEVIVVDNGSQQSKTFEVFEKFKGQQPNRFRVIDMDIPFNYSKLNNQGVHHAKGQLIVLLNNDTKVITPNWLEEMAGQALRPSIGAVGAMLLYPDHTIQHAGLILGIVGPANHGHKGVHEKSPGYFGRLLIPANYAAVTGACLMVKRELYEAVAGLDENLAIAYNDVDFCLKLLKHGLYNVIVPQVQLIHYESKSRGKEGSSEKQERLKQEAHIMEQRWGALISRDPFYNSNLTLQKEDFSTKMLEEEQIDS